MDGHETEPVPYIDDDTTFSIEAEEASFRIFKDESRKVFLSRYGIFAKVFHDY